MEKVKYQATGDNVVVERLPSAIGEQALRGRVISVGRLVNKDIKPGLVAHYHGALTDRIDEKYSLVTTANYAIKVTDPRKIEDVHECLGGVKSPGVSENCEACKNKGKFNIRLLNVNTNLGNQKPVHKTFFSDLAAGKITPEEARDVYKIPIGDEEQFNHYE